MSGGVGLFIDETSNDHVMISNEAFQSLRIEISFVLVKPENPSLRPSKQNTCFDFWVASLFLLFVIRNVRTKKSSRGGFSLRFNTNSLDRLTSFARFIFHLASTGLNSTIAPYRPSK